MMTKMTRTGSLVSWPLDAHTDRFFRRRGEGDVGMGKTGEHIPVSRLRRSAVKILFSVLQASCRSVE